MSSGFKLLARRLRAIVYGTEDRIQALRNAGRTVDLDAIPPQGGGEIIELDLGYGTEFWLVPEPPPVPDRELTFIENGRLILEMDRKLTSVRRLREKGLKLGGWKIRF
ncbi:MULTISPECIES: hypothetical protein [Sorangium]|uniref:Uncharacterized protein n=1 Tax=Sorangium cellulosum TaxID=56 RepID=A0A4P2R6G6_SORCE|nr:MULTISPECIES: hypothetical protein [Sorangium]AUX37643.1 uncharacterized protein SOCE836_098730 [Sorangium cellulosum]WCQ96933.1 hypothetical protein NQZ70_09723 [Sorangium sp. Soce836]